MDPQFTPLTGSQPAPLPDFGKNPLPAGKPYLSDHTKSQLAAVGWKEGDPLPPNFAERLAEIRAEVQAERAAAFDALPNTMAGYVPPKNTMVDIESLPPEKRAEIQNWLTGFKQDVEILSTAPPITTTQQQQQPTPQLPPIQQIQEPVTTPQAAAQQPTGEASGRDTHTHCQRCLWPLEVPFNVTATEADKRMYMISVLGLSVFQKEYVQFGGAIKIKVRSLTVPEVVALNLQLGYMNRAGIIDGNLEYAYQNILFRTALGVTQISGPTGAIYVSKPPDRLLDEGNEPPTVLPKMLEDFTAALRTEPVVRTAMKCYQHFQRLAEMLEEMTSDESFWPGIDSQG